MSTNVSDIFVENNSNGAELMIDGIDCISQCDSVRISISQGVESVSFAIQARQVVPVSNAEDLLDLDDVFDIIEDTEGTKGNEATKVNQVK